IIGVPIGIALHSYVVPVMAHTAGTNLPHAYITVYRGTETVLLALGGLAIAIAGALLPASWAPSRRQAIGQAGGRLCEGEPSARHWPATVKLSGTTTDRRPPFSLRDG